MRRWIDITGKTLGQVLIDLEEAGYPPLDAEFEYDGCGTHQVTLVWDDGAPASPPPPPSPEEIAQEAADRKAGF